MSFEILEIQPLFTGVITTAKRFVGNVTTKNGLILPNKMEGQLNYFQTVIAAGPHAQGLKKGDIVRVNFKRFAVAKHTPGAIDADQNIQSDNMTMAYQIPTVEIAGETYLQLHDTDIEYVVTKYKVDEGGLLE